MRLFVIIIILVLSWPATSAQEKVLLYSHYTFNGLAINPAFSGSRDVMSINLSHRNQWVGFDGAPAYNIAGIHTPLRNTKMGLGFLVMNESMGLRKATGFYFNYAHRITLGRGKLALGLKAGVSTGKYDYIDLGNDDYVFSDKLSGYVLPNFGLGMYYYSRKFFAGLSVPLILGYETNENGEVTAYHDFNKYPYYLTAGVTVELAAKWSLQPSGLLVYEKSGGVIADLGAMAIYKDLIKAGASYRTKQAIVMLIDIKINNQLRAGLAYDYGLNALNEYNRNSFEVALEYNFGYQIKAANPTIF